MEVTISIERGTLKLDISREQLKQLLSEVIADKDETEKALSEVTNSRKIAVRSKVGRMFGSNWRICIKQL